MSEKADQGIPANGAGGRKLKVLYLDTEYVWRGGQDQLFGLMREMARRRHDIWLAAPQHSPLRLKAREASLPTIPFSQRLEVSPVAVLKLFRILKDSSFDVLHLNTPRAILAGAVAARLEGRTLIVSSRRVNFPLRSKLSAWKYNWLVDQVITVSDSINNTLVAEGVRPEIVTTVYEGVDMDWFDSINRARIPVGSPGPIVGTVAHLSSEKGHKILIQAVELLKNRFPKARFLIVGDGILEAELREVVSGSGLSDRIFFTGFRSDSEALMKSFDIFCLPSLSEGLSSAILAAMAVGLPVVASRVGGIPELVEDGTTGMLVSPGDAVELAAKLGLLIEDRGLRLKMGKAGRKRVEEEFTSQRKLAQTEALYFELLDRRALR